MSPLKKLKFISVTLSSPDLSGRYRSVLRRCLPFPTGTPFGAMNFPWGSRLRQGDIQLITFMTFFSGLSN